MNYQKLKAYFHVHTDSPVLQFTNDPHPRRIELLKNPPKDTKGFRWHLLKPVKGKLPSAVVRALAALNTAKATQLKAEHSWEEQEKRRINWINVTLQLPDSPFMLTIRKDILKTIDSDIYMTLEPVKKAIDRERMAMGRLMKVVDKFRPSLKKIHDRECKPCPWNRETTSPAKVDSPRLRQRSKPQ
mgnify:CR=1 FL=1